MKKFGSRSLLPSSVSIFGEKWMMDCMPTVLFNYKPWTTFPMNCKYTQTKKQLLHLFFFTSFSLYRTTMLYILLTNACEVAIQCERTKNSIFFFLFRKDLLHRRLINCVSVGQGRDNFVLGSLITSSESLNESQSAITHDRGSCDTVKKYPWCRKASCILGESE